MLLKIHAVTPRTVAPSYVLEESNDKTFFPGLYHLGGGSQFPHTLHVENQYVWKKAPWPSCLSALQVTWVFKNSLETLTNLVAPILQSNVVQPRKPTASLSCWKPELALIFITQTEDPSVPFC